MVECVHPLLQTCRQDFIVLRRKAGVRVKSVDELVARADSAMYAAKAGGRDRVITLGYP